MALASQRIASLRLRQPVWMRRAAASAAASSSSSSGDDWDGWGPRKANKNAKIRETDNFNNRRLRDCTIYLHNFVYWVGFVTGITLTTPLSTANFIDFLLLLKSAFETGLLFSRERALLSNLPFFFVFGRTLIPECAYRRWDHFHPVVNK